MELNVDWSANAHLALKQEVAQLQPVTSCGVHVPHFNILLVGQVGAGKSSFFNTIKSIFRGHITSQAVAGEAAHSLTTNFRSYKVSSRRDINPFQWRICDTMGLEAWDDRGVRQDVLELVVDGYICDQSPLNIGLLSTIVARLKNNPALSQKMHCVALVIDASNVAVMQSEIWRKMRSF